jgi:hypothetical protein
MPAGRIACTNTQAPSASQASKKGSNAASPIGTPLMLLPTSTPGKPSVFTTYSSSRDGQVHVLQRHRAQAGERPPLSATMPAIWSLR